jgi:NADPH:quinone reductase-like Zn-dependent oxidoreductase
MIELRGTKSACEVRFRTSTSIGRGPNDENDKGHPVNFGQFWSTRGTIYFDPLVLVMTFLALKVLRQPFPARNISHSSLLIKKFFSNSQSINMHTVQVTQWGEGPKYTEAPTPELPLRDSNLVQIKLQATGLHQVVRARAQGTHYSAKTLPHTPGVDGVGLTTSGQQVYFHTFGVPTGSFTEIINVPKEDVAPLPEGVDAVQVAAATNPMLSSWMALRRRTTNLPTNFSVLIIGATSASGTVAIDVARHLGAKRVIGLARNMSALKERGLDEAIQIKDPVEETDLSKIGHVDVILDYVYGPITAHVLGSLKPTAPVQFVQIGTLGTPTMELTASILRSKDITMRGTGPGSWSMGDLRAELPALAMGTKALRPIAVKVSKLSDIESAWEGETKERMVFVP